MTRQDSLRKPQLVKDPQVKTRKINKRLQPRGPLRAGKTWMSGNVNSKAAGKLIVHAQPSEIAFAAMQPNHRCAGTTDEVFDAGTTHRHKFSLERHLHPTTTLGRLFEWSWQSQFLAHLPDRRQDLLLHEPQASHRVLVSDGPIVAPNTEDTRPKYLQPLPDLPNDGLGTTDHDAIAFDYRVPSGGIDAAVERVRTQGMFVLLQQPLRTFS